MFNKVTPEKQGLGFIIFYANLTQMFCLFFTIVFMLKVFHIKVLLQVPNKLSLIKTSKWIVGAGLK